MAGGHKHERDLGVAVVRRLGTCRWGLFEGSWSGKAVGVNETPSKGGGVVGHQWDLVKGLVRGAGVWA